MGLHQQSAEIVVADFATPLALVAVKAIQIPETA
jgi:hypothetical protein